jgi:hypothetical protein
MITLFEEIMADAGPAGKDGALIGLAVFFLWVGIVLSFYILMGDDK